MDFLSGRKGQRVWFLPLKILESCYSEDIRDGSSKTQCREKRGRNKPWYTHNTLKRSREKRPEKQTEKGVASQDSREKDRIEWRHAATEVLEEGKKCPVSNASGRMEKVADSAGKHIVRGVVGTEAQMESL